MQKPLLPHQPLACPASLIDVVKDRFTFIYIYKKEVAIARYYEKTDLKRMLGSRVDLVRIRDGMNSLLRERIRKEAVYV